MSRDYSRKPQKNRPAATPRKQAKAAPRKRDAQPARKSVAKAQHGGLSLKWILSLATVGGFIGFIVYLNSLPTPDQTRTPSGGQDQAETTTESPAKNPENKKPGFKFYDMLPDSEVVPPKVDEYTPGPGQTTFDYLVQTGSFRTEKDAERQRAEIAFQGLRAFVTQIDLDSGSTWYRVNVGPFTSRSQMNSAVDKLVSINIEPLVRKVPKDKAEDN
ncbi:SPOR domain-containing protein [Marinobacter confluentis]|uniref:Sporulation protein n=1 Tax=Marinobacter confluentis TaxID=1697557 RepID=A0A4Z1B9Z0_9GAMM|nr:SPOR domain-containing protein [Marinobacter confluentis]TGN38493.1 sporulation protein [Marinobacter confluentis]